MNEDPTFSLLDLDAALIPFLRAADETAKSVNVSTARALVGKALSQAEIFCGYDQIKHSLQACFGKAVDGGKVLKTLDLFSYGTFGDYLASPEEYMTLTEAQLHKLRQLTVLALVQTACQQKQSAVTYEEIQRALNVHSSSKDAVEDVLISCIYSRVVRGQLCQKTRRLLLLPQHGPPLRSRDVPPRRVAGLLDAVRRLQQSIESSQNDVRKDRDQVMGQLEWSRHEAQKHRQHLRNAKDLASGRIPQSAVTWARGEGHGGRSALASAAAVALATGQDPASYLDGALAGGAGDDGDAAGSRRQKRSRGGLSSIADSGFGGRFQL
jgi:COP9 signalosome complex subunit 7